MKTIENTLYLELSEVVECGAATEGYLRKAKSTGSKAWHFINDPDDLRRVLIGYEKLSPDNKGKVEAQFGNPYDLVARQPILEMVQHCPDAHDIFFKHTYERAGKTVTLTPQQIAQSTRSHAWLSLVLRVSDNKNWKEIKKTLGLKAVPEFFTHAAALIALEVTAGKKHGATLARQLPGNFPGTYQKLRARAARLTEEGHAACLPTGLANKAAAKIGKTEEGYDPAREEEMVATLRKVAALHVNLDAAQVATLANGIFKSNGWPTLSRSRVYQLMEEWEATLTPGRKGKRTYRSNVSKQIQRSAPTFPLTYWTLDGWTAELLFQANGKYHYRLDVVVVLDAAGKYPIGYAIGDQEDPTLIKAAMRNAVEHTAELFGQRYRVGQLQSDNYAIKALTPFYQACSHLFTPAAVGNSKAKIIEPYFMYLNKKYCQLLPNWSGFNVTARQENQVNREFTQMMRHQLPDRAGVIAQIEQIIATERLKKIGDYMAAFDTVPADRLYPFEYLSAEWLTVFGEQLGDRTSSITGKGLQKSIGGQTVTFDTFDTAFCQQLHLDWTLFGDRQDLSKVLAVSPDQQQRFVLDRKMTVPMAIADQQAEHHTYRAQVTAFNKEAEAQIIATYASDNDTLRGVLRNTAALDKEAEALLKLMPTYGGQQKHQLQLAKGLGTDKKKEPDNWAAQQAAYLAGKADLNQFLD